MRFHVFTIEVRDPGPGQDALNVFCAQHRLADVEKRFVDQGLNSYWTFCVATLDGEDSSRPAAERKRIDYREVLNEADFAVYADLRGLRRSLAEHEGVPQFALFTYFPSIDHAILVRLLARRFKGADFLALLGRIIASCPAAPGRGLPIGSLTSQHFANHYLDGADRFLLAHPLVRAQVRYMDDIICWGDDRQSVRQVVGDLREWLQRERHLTLKANVQINRSERGVSYCGARVLRGSLRLTPRKQARYRHGCRRWEAAWLAGIIDEATLQRAYAAVLAPTLHCDSLSWRKRHLELHPSRYSEQ
ncbi:RNA-directed DNA polymerase [Candidatus Accumulibacter vicinus]|uniref:Retron-type reverse transcriptase n=1 Tax=Candidatus Accumulibacter vicinus TaxID=2954382 RepID=A0A084Y135_9PROT|nr:RNA-directed DNA polymerase [Candidatus Accumulibacter vicinus]KFB68429.1 MAG: Retron-type reverse transcriptase [Candidatus Accumulibacter vicinus]